MARRRKPKGGTQRPEPKAERLLTDDDVFAMATAVAGMWCSAFRPAAFLALRATKPELIGAPFSPGLSARLVFEAIAHVAVSLDAEQPGVGRLIFGLLRAQLAQPAPQGLEPPGEGFPASGQGPQEAGPQ